MIVISGALVLVAAVLLVLGIISSITLVYAAIGLSIVSAVFLLVGVFQRPAPAGEPRESESDGTRRQAARRDDADEPEARPVKQQVKQQVKVAKAVEPEPEPAQHIDLADDRREVDEVAADFPLEKANADFEARSGATGADVLVISGRPRYHVGGCEYVEGNPDSEPLEINEARELGFTPCGACRPNETLARSAAGRQHTPSPKPSPAAVSEPPTASFEPAPVTVAAAPAVAPTTAPTTRVADPQQNHVAPPQQAPAPPPPVSEPVGYAAPPAPPAEPAPVAEPAPAAEPAPPPVAVEPAPQPVAAEPPAAPPTPPTAAPPGRTGRAPRTVLAVASTKEYHRPDCEMLVGAEVEEITRVAAIRQGYLACGVCKP